ncbi:MAG: aldehyde dehydrogenase family protein, partial [Actinobacteria bacterium]
MNGQQALDTLGIREVNSGVYAGKWLRASGGLVPSHNPADESLIASVGQATAADYEQVVTNSQSTFHEWRMLPAPQRGEYVRRIGNALRDDKAALGALVSMEVGKIRAEGEGEVQEMIDIADFAVGLSRQLYGLTISSERPRHRMYEQWHPLGPVGVITSFNFPVAVWSWNAFIAAVCGDTLVWKPSHMAPLSAVAVQNIVHEVMAGTGFEGVFNLLVGPADPVGNLLVEDHRVPLISATGSVRMGATIGPKVAARLGRSLLELGGNNAIIVMDDADLDLTLRAALFAAVGTAGQRCTSLRRLIVHRDVSDRLAKALVDAYGQVSIGDPLQPGTLMGPLINADAVATAKAALDIALEQGGELLTGGRILDRPGHFFEPTLVKV